MNKECFMRKHCGAIVVQALWLVLASFLTLPLVGRAMADNPYDAVVGEELVKGMPLTIPREFVLGTATQKEAEQWLAALRNTNSYYCDESCKSELFTLSVAGKKKYFLSIPLFLAQNPAYFLFQLGMHGYQYIGMLNHPIRWLTYPTGHVYLLSAYHGSVNDGSLNLTQLRDGKLLKIGKFVEEKMGKPISGCVNDKIANDLFGVVIREAGVISETDLQRLFCVVQQPHRGELRKK